MIVWIMKMKMMKRMIQALIQIKIIKKGTKLRKVSQNEQEEMV